MIFVLNKKIPLKSDILHFRKKIKIFWFFPKMKKFWFLPYHRCTANRQTIYRWSLVAQKVFKCEVFYISDLVRKPKKNVRHFSLWRNAFSCYCWKILFNFFHDCKLVATCISTAVTCRTKSVQMRGFYLSWW